jgi:hypothetical protein
VFIVTYLQRQTEEEGLNGYFAMMDLQKAFPSLPRQEMLNKLQVMGASPQFLKVSTALFQISEMDILTGPEGSASIKATIGTPEGSSASPAFFIHFTADLPGVIDRAATASFFINERQINIVLFADDSGLGSTTISGMQNILDAFVDYCTVNKLKINANKTVIINFRRRARLRKAERWQVEGTEVRISKTGDYLGVRLQSGRVGVAHIQKLKIRGRIRAVKLVASLKKNGCEDTKFGLNIFHTYVGASCLYAVHLLFPLSETQAKFELNTVLFTFLRKFWSLPPGSSNFGVQLMAGARCLSCSAYVHAVSFLLRKIRAWGLNSPAVEEILSIQVTQARAEANGDSTLPPFWLKDILRFAAEIEMEAPCLDSIEEFRASVGRWDMSKIQRFATRHCLRHCITVSEYRKKLMLSFCPLDSEPKVFQRFNFREHWALRAAITGGWRRIKDLVKVGPSIDHCPFCLDNNPEVSVDDSVDDGDDEGTRDGIEHWLLECTSMTEHRKRIVELLPYQDELPAVLGMEHYLRLLEFNSGITALSEFCWKAFDNRVEYWKTITQSGENRFASTNQNNDQT